MTPSQREHVRALAASWRAIAAAASSNAKAAVALGLRLDRFVAGDTVYELAQSMARELDALALDDEERELNIGRRVTLDQHMAKRNELYCTECHRNFSTADELLDHDCPELADLPTNETEH